jgi:NAD dependent epimerase/dehydratase family enzyme
MAMTRQVTALIERLNRAPGVLINGSAIGWYGLRGDEALTPSSSAPADPWAAAGNGCRGSSATI